MHPSTCRHRAASLMKWDPGHQRAGLQEELRGVEAGTHRSDPISVQPTGKLNSALLGPHLPGRRHSVRG